MCTGRASCYWRKKILSSVQTNSEREEIILSLDSVSTPPDCSLLAQNALYRRDLFEAGIKQKRRPHNENYMFNSKGIGFFKRSQKSRKVAAMKKEDYRHQGAMSAETDTDIQIPIHTYIHNAWTIIMTYLWVHSSTFFFLHSCNLSAFCDLLKNPIPFELNM